MLRGGETLEVGGVRIAVRAAAPPAADASAPRSRPHLPGRAGRACRPPPSPRPASLVGAAVVLAATRVLGGGERAPEVVRAVAPATVLVRPAATARPPAAAAAGSRSPGSWSRSRTSSTRAASFVVGTGSELRRASVLAAAPCEDLAVLQVPGWRDEARLALGDDGDVEQGETVLALGYPAGSGPGEDASSTRGVVSAARTTFRDPAPDVPVYAEAIRTDTALDPGFSGGPLVDLDRNVVGVNAAARTAGEDGRRLQGANYAIAAGARARACSRSSGAGARGRGSGRTSAIRRRRSSPPGSCPRGSFCSAPWPAPRRRWPGLGGRGELLTAVNGRAVGRTLAGWCAATRGIASGARAAPERLGPTARRGPCGLRFG